MLIKIIKMILYFFIIFAKPVYADDFDITKDVVNNKFVSTIAFTTNGYPNIQNILYDKSSFMAEDTDSVYMDGIDGLVDTTAMRRIYNVADHVSAAPGTQVDVVYLYRNSTEHDVNISAIDLVLSRNNRSLGDLTQLVDVGNVREEPMTYKYAGISLTKTGLHKEYILNKTISTREENGFVLDTLTVKNPLKMEKVTASRGSGSKQVDVKIYIRNESNEYLNNIKLTYGGYSEIFDITAYNEHISQFSIDTEADHLDSVDIDNPNVKEICMVLGSPYYNYTNTDSIPVFTIRDGSLIPSATVQPSQESFCIKRIPYTMKVNNISITDKEDIPSVLGVTTLKELPKTGKYTNLFLTLLVVGVLLCYPICILRR